MAGAPHAIHEIIRVVLALSVDTWSAWLNRNISGAGLRELQRDVRFRSDRDARLRALRELDEARSAADLLAAVNRSIPGGASQIADEILAFIEFVEPRAPRTFVEIGTEAGGTHLLFGRALASLEQTIAVDLRVCNRRSLRGLGRRSLRTDVIEGDSSSPQTLERVRSTLGGRPIDLLFIDGDHSFRGALTDLLSYRPLVRPGGLIAFHDIVPDGWLRSGVSTPAYAGEVPLIWKHVRSQFTSHEFVASWDQEGKGIGAIEHDARVAIDPLAHYGQP